jgi:SAM-dependent methyltransferase
MLPQHYFRRMDERDDEFFYAQPRLVVHIDQDAIRRTTNLFREYLPAGGDILDLMSSWRSHLPDDISYGRVVGLGMNEAELARNEQLSEYVVQNLNVRPLLPFADASFDAAIVTVSVQYLTRPVAVFREVGRVLRPGAPFLTIFSNRMFPTKAVAIWRMLDSGGHAQLVSDYYHYSEVFTEVEAFDCSPEGGDPLYLVVGHKQS